MRTSGHHQAKAGVEGKCSRPMWSGFGECFCDEPAWGQQYTLGSPHGQYWDRPGTRGEYGNYQPYVPALCCKAHGGPGPNQIRFIRDGNMWCAFMPGFVNLQESIAGFGETQTAAEADLRMNERKAA